MPTVVNSSQLSWQLGHELGIDKHCPTPNRLAVVLVNCGGGRALVRSCARVVVFLSGRTAGGGGGGGRPPVLATREGLNQTSGALARPQLGRTSRVGNYIFGVDRIMGRMVRGQHMSYCNIRANHVQYSGEHGGSVSEVQHPEKLDKPVPSSSHGMGHSDWGVLLVGKLVKSHWKTSDDSGGRQ